MNSLHRMASAAVSYELQGHYMASDPGGLLTTLFGGGAGGAVLVGLAKWWGKRKQDNAYTMGAVDHAVQTAMGLVTDRLERVEGQHQACEESLRTVNTKLDEALREIDRLMLGRVARYGEEAPP